MNSSNPLVTILIPCYNVEKYIDACLYSIIRQTYSNLQIVLIDDGSSDNTWGELQRYVEKDSRIEIYHQPNQGVANTRNNLIEKVKGDYTLFIDSDDWIEPDMVEFLVAKVLIENADIAMCGMIINNSNTSTEYCERILTKEETIEAFLLHNDIKGSLCNKLVNSSLLKNECFESNIGYGEDALFCWQLFQKSDKTVFTNKRLYHYRMNNMSISHQSFGANKLTGHLVWQSIASDTHKKWPQYLSIAQARWGMEDMYLLRLAGQSAYKYNDSIRELQATVKKFIPQMKSIGLLKGKEILNANIMCRWYGYSLLYSNLNKLKNLLK